MGWWISRLRGGAALLVLLSVAGAAGAAPAQTPAQKEARIAARAKLVEGVALLKKSDFAGALSRFQSAFELVPSPNIHYDLGLAYTGLGRPADALLAFDRFLAEAPTAPETSREKARSNQEILRRQVAALAISADVPGVEISVDGQARGGVPLSHPIYLDPGPHQIVARWPGGAGNVSSTVVAFAGSDLTMRLQLPGPGDGTAAPAARAVPAVAAEPEPAPSNLIERKMPSAKEPSLWSNAALASAGAGVVLLGAGLTFGLLANHEASRLTDLSSQSTADDPRKYPPDAQSRGQTFDMLFKLSLGAGALALGAAAIMLVVNNSRNGSAHGATAGNNGRDGLSF
jgi:tetratricopeptide (TPR) repeat protein